MAKVGFSIAHMEDGLEPVLNHVGEYLRQNAASEENPLTFESAYGLHIRVGRDEFVVSPKAQSASLEPSTLPASLYSFSELEELNISSPPPIIEGLLHEGETILLAGRGKVGKSRLVQQMSLSIVTGSDFLGMRLPQCRRVLIIDLENRIPVVRDRMMRMAGANTQLPGWFVWCSSSLSDETVDCSEHGIERLRCMVEQTRADVLVIDPWRLFLGRDENNAEDIVNGLKRLSRLRTTHPRLAILIVHHVRKDRFESPRNLLNEPRLWTDAVSGHHALSSHVDACYGLERQRDEESGDELIVFGGVARNTEPRTILLEDDEETLLFSVEHSEAALDALLTKAEKPIWETAKLLRQFAFNKLQLKANTKNRKAVSSVLKKAKAQGLLRYEGKSYIVLRTDT